MKTHTRIRITGIGLATCLLTASSLCAQPVKGGDFSPQVRVISGEELEDSDRIQRRYKGLMGPDQYRRAFESTGMAEAITSGSTQQAIAGVGSEWMPLGPFGDFQGASWNGRVAGIQIVRFGATYRVYAGACSGGLWRSDGQALGTWVSLGDNLPNPSVRAFAVDPNNLQRIFVGTGDFQRWKGGGMFVTLNEGATWNPVSLPVTPEAFYRLNFVPGLANWLVAASDQGLLLSTDSGTTWSVQQQGDFTDLVINPSTPLLMYACRRGFGVYRSVTSGVSWTLISDPDLPPGNDWGRASIALCPQAPNVLAIVVEKNGAVQGVYYSTDGGNDWANITGPLAGYGDGQMWHAQAIAFHPNNPKQIYVGEVSLARTDNAGTTWLRGQPETGINIFHGDITQLYFSPETGNDVLWICNDAGIYKHNIGGGTTSVNGGANGLTISQVGDLDADRLMRVAGLQDDGILRSIDGGQNWTAVQGNDGGYVEITDPEANHFWFYQGVPWDVYRLVFGGSSELVTSPGAASGLVFNRADGRMYSASDQSIVSRPAGGNVTDPWTQEVTSLQSDPYSIFEMIGDDVVGQTIFVTYRRGNERDLTVCRKQGGVWTVYHRENIEPTATRVVWAYPSQQSASDFWVSLEGPAGTPKILHTMNDGATWQDVTGNLSGVQAVKAFAATPFNPQVLYAGTDFGMFRSLNGGVTWEPFMSGLPIAPCSRLRFVVDDQHLGNHKLILATFGRGVWERVVPGPAIIYVDKTNLGFEDGTFEHPYSTVAKGANAASTSAIVAIRGNTYTEPQTISKALTLVAYGGASIIR